MVARRGINCSDTKVGSRKSGCPLITSLLQPVVLSTETKSKVETDFGSKPIKSVSLPGNFQNGTPETIRLSLQGEWVTSLDFSNAYFHIPIQQRSRKYLRFFLNGQKFQFTAPLSGWPQLPWSLQRWSRR